MEENGQRVDKGVRNLEKKNLEEANNRISETSSELNFTRKDMKIQLYMIRSLMRRLRGSELTFREKVAAII